LFVTPVHIHKHLARGSLVLEGVNTLVLDEADRMLDMGFYDSIAGIIAQTPARRQTLLFSATYPDGIRQIAAQFMHTPEQIIIANEQTAPRIEQRFFEIDPAQRIDTVAQVLACFRPVSCVAFCFTRQQCQDVADALCARGMTAMALHGDMDQRERDDVLIRFANRSLTVLVATDVAARGLDIDGLDLVINVELGRDVETHVHRIGRTGRAGEKGTAVSLVAPPE